jgi:sigma-54 dependent transcriptional regulator, acetoin dehydrogenase operon transcriptional activator AcoR
MNTPFVTTRDERVASARLRYFEEGVLPTGVVSDAIFQSWTRCHRSQRQPKDPVSFQAVSASRAQLALQKNQELHEVWLKEMPTLLGSLAATHCSAILTDPQGVLIGATPAGHATNRIMPLAHRVGVNLSEEEVGTTAPGIVVRTGQQASVQGSEHYFDAVRTMHCTAAPVRNIHGQLAGILDISSEGVPFAFDPASVVGLYAASIENRLLLAQSRDLFVVKFQCMPSMMETPMVAMLGFDFAGQWIWANTAANKFLGTGFAKQVGSALHIDEIFDARFDQLASHLQDDSFPVQLRNGLQVFIRCVVQGRGRFTSTAVSQPLSKHVSNEVSFPETDSAAVPSVSSSAAATATPDYLPATSLRQRDADLIRNSLQENKGNVSMVARQLQVSRGLIYRRLQELGIDPVQCKHILGVPKR